MTLALPSARPPCDCSEIARVAGLDSVVGAHILLEHPTGLWLAQLVVLAELALDLHRL